jgi:hypothetical protein
VCDSLGAHDGTVLFDWVLRRICFGNISVITKAGKYLETISWRHTDNVCILVGWL